jgi:hypothetical protein
MKTPLTIDTARLATAETRDKITIPRQEPKAQAWNRHLISAQNALKPFSRIKSNHISIENPINQQLIRQRRNDAILGKFGGSPQTQCEEKIEPHDSLFRAKNTSKMRIYRPKNHLLHTSVKKLDHCLSFRRTFPVTLPKMSRNSATMVDKSTGSNAQPAARSLSHITGETESIFAENQHQIRKIRDRTNPVMAHRTDRIPKRMTICGSFHPPISK